MADVLMVCWRLTTTLWDLPHSLAAWSKFALQRKQILYAVVVAPCTADGGVFGC